MKSTRIKICGICVAEDAAVAVQAGVDALGFVFSDSPRSVVVDEAAAIIQNLPPFVTAVGIFVDAPAEYVHSIVSRCGLRAVQFQGHETPDYCAEFNLPVIKGIKVSDKIDPNFLDRYAVSAFLFDTFVSGSAGGTGRAFDWSLLSGARIPRPFVLAGGLHAGNVTKAIRAVEPYGVDVSSGVAAAKPRRKDANAIFSFVEAVRKTDADRWESAR